MFKLEDAFKSEDGYHVVELHSQDEAFAKILVEAMEVKGYTVYSFSDRGGSKQYSFVDAEFREVLRERHLHSCRNSLGGVIDPQVISRAFRKGVTDNVKIVDIDMNKPIVSDEKKFVPNDLSPGLGSLMMGSGRLDD